jgi:cob(I)alamin adenosyltransferase
MGIQVYTGNGKGKTTAAIGLALRASGQGMKVLICQFLKGGGEPSGEIKALERSCTPIMWKIFDQTAPVFLKNKDEIEILKRQIEDSISFVKSIIENRDVDLLILDEINVVLSNGLYPVSAFIDIISKRSQSMEIVLTGRGASEEVCSMADLVTEMVEIKHPFQKGIGSRRGIEY